MDYTASVLKKSDDPEFTALLDGLGKKYEQVLGYHYPFYRDMLVATGVGEPLYIGIRGKEDGRLHAVLPGFLKVNPEGTVYSSLPFFGPNGGLLCDFRSQEKRIYYKLCFQYLFEVLTGYDMVSASFYTPFNAPEEIEHFRDQLPDALSIEKFTSYIPLKQFKLSNEYVDSSALRNVRKAVKEGVTIRTNVNPSDIENIYGIYLQNCRDYGIPVKPKQAISFLLTSGDSKNDVKTYIAEHEGNMIGALIMIWSQLTASYYIPCNVHEFRSLQPNAILIATAMEEAIGAGMEFWNWESSPSKESGVYQFKKKWGSVDSNYSIFIKPFREKSFFESMGQAKISQLYPYFFVYPFNLIEA